MCFGVLWLWCCCDGHGHGGGDACGGEIVVKVAVSVVVIGEGERNTVCLGSIDKCVTQAAKVVPCLFLPIHTLNAKNVLNQ